MVNYVGEELLVFVGTVGLVVLFNRLGYFSRKSGTWRLLSLLIVIIVDAGGVVALFSQRESPFALSLTISNAQVDKVEIAKAPIAMSLHGVREQGGDLVFADDKSREYVASMPHPLPAGRTVVALVPLKTVRGFNVGEGGGYLIMPLGPCWIVAVGEDFVLLVLLLPGSVGLWYAGTKGRLPPDIEA